MKLRIQVSIGGSWRRWPSRRSRQLRPAGVASFRPWPIGGYYPGEEILACDEAGIITYVAKSDTSGKGAKGEFGRGEFRYIAKDDEYECRAGEHLIYRFSGEQAGKKLRRYWASACIHCPIRPKCTPAEMSLHELA